MAVTTESSTCSRSVLIAFTFPVTKRHPVNINFQKKVQHVKEVQSVLSC